MERDFKGIWIPKEIWCSKDMTVMEKLFLVEIDSLDNEKGCFASNQYFSEFFDLSKNRCSEIIKSLESKNFIKIDYIYENGKKNIEKRVINVVGKPNTPIRKVDRPIRKTEKGYSENCEDNNTSFNNKLNIQQVEQLWNLYPNKKGKAVAVKKIPKLIKEIGYEELQRCIERYSKEVKGTEIQFMKHGSTFFNGGYVDYLDKNYKEIVDMPKIDVINRPNAGAYRYV